MSNRLTREAAVAAYLAGEGSYAVIGERAGVSAPTVMRWVKAFQDEGRLEKRPAHPPRLEVFDGGAQLDAQVTGNGRVSVSAASLDERARTLLRRAVERCLEAAAGEDGEEWDPKRAKDAALTMAVLVDKCPGILGLDQATQAEAVETGPAAGSAEEKAELVELLRKYPGLLKEVAG